MSNNQLFIPEKIRVGFQHRLGTYENILAYVIYYDAKGNLRKEQSWENWRHDPEKEYDEYDYHSRKRITFKPSPKIAPRDLDNVPTSGFVLNKGVGGIRASWGRNARNEYIRIWDPRGMEFEISVPNLIYILMHTNCNKRQLEGEFVYSWHGKELVLLPVGTEEYKASKGYTDLQGQKVSARDLVEGHIYETKKQEELVYLGRFPYFYVNYSWKSDNYPFVTKKFHLFIDLEDKNKKIFPVQSVPSKIGRKIGGLHPEYADFIELFKKSFHSSPIKEVIHKPIELEMPEEGKGCNMLLGYKQTEGGYYPVTLYGHSRWDHKTKLRSYEYHLDCHRRYIITNKEGSELYLNRNSGYSWNDARWNNIKMIGLPYGLKSYSEMKETLETLNLVQPYFVNDEGKEIKFESFYKLDKKTH